MANYHVIKNRDSEQWHVRKEGAEHNSALADTQEEAEEIAKKLSGNSGGGEVRIHGPDGKIEDSDTVPPGNDPYPPADRKH